jgi:shikimate dehydrogenase
VTLRLGLLGHPVDHSLSPTVHRAGLAPLGIAATYELIDVAPNALAETMRRCFEIGFTGLNLTLPHKRAAMQYAESITPLAEQVGAANTLVRGSSGWVAHNTDSPGLQLAMRDFGVEPKGTALIIGGGGAASAALDALKQLGFLRIDVAVRRPAAARHLAASAVLPLDTLAEHIGTYQCVVHATPCGLPLQPVAPLDVTRLSRDALLIDLVYRRDAKGTELTRAAQQHGLRACDGRAMLVHQAAVAQHLWLGHRAPIANMMAALDD